MREQRQLLRPPSGWGYSAWPFLAEQALATLTPEGWCQLGWIERANHRRVTHLLRYQVEWQVDTGEVRLERETMLKAHCPRNTTRITLRAGDAGVLERGEHKQVLANRNAHCALSPSFSMQTASPAG